MILFEKKYQTFDTVFHHQMKHLEVRQKYSAARRISTLFSVFHLVMKHCISCLIYYFKNFTVCRIQEFLQFCSVQWGVCKTWTGHLGMADEKMRIEKNADDKKM